MKQEGCPGAALNMSLPQPLKIHVHHRVAIHDDKIFRELFKSGQNRSGSTEGFALDNVLNSHSPTTAIAKVLLDDVGAVTSEYDDLVEPVLASQFDLMFQQGLAGD